MIFEKKVIEMYKSALIKRQDPDGAIFYFGKEDFPGMECEDLAFAGDKGQRLAAHLYYKGERRTDRLVMFEHGMGAGGHTSYMQEINLLCEHGYTVFTYDHTGTRESEGESIYGFSQSLADLDYAIKFVRSSPEYAKADISVIGHSWGGFSTMNAPSVYHNVKHVVALSGFIAPRVIQEQFFTGFLKLYRKAIFKAECEAFPDYAETDARKTLKKAKAKALIIHSRDDKTCLFDNHFEELRRALSMADNVEFIAVDGKGHNPNYTFDAVQYKDEMSAEYERKKKFGELETTEQREAFRNSWDWGRMTKQDMNIWSKIFEFLDN